MDKLLSPEEAAEILGIKADQFRRLCNDGDITFIRLGKKGGRIRVRPADLDAYLDRNTVTAQDHTNPVLTRLKGGNSKATA